MASIEDKTKTSSDRGNYRLPENGPHRFVKKEVPSEKEKDQEPPYVVGIVKKNKIEDENKPSKPVSKYDPGETRARGKTYLNNPNITSNEKNVLKEILGPDEVPVITAKG
jgi:flagellar basal body rod protein FlgC